MAVLRSQLGTAEVLADAGADADAVLRDGRPLLVEMASRADSAAVRFLLAHGARQGREDALRTATVADAPEVVSALLAAGAKPDDADVQGWTALLLAARTGHVRSSTVSLPPVPTPTAAAASRVAARLCWPPPRRRASRRRSTCWAPAPIPTPATAPARRP